MVPPLLTDIRQRDLGEHSVTEINSMITVLGGRQNELCLRHVAGVQIQRTRFGVRRMLSVLTLPAIRLVFPIRQPRRILKSLDREQGFFKVGSHRGCVVSAGLEFNRR